MLDNSSPDIFTPRSCTVAPLPLTKRLPLTAMENALLLAALIEIVEVAGVPRLAPVDADSVTAKLLPPAPVLRIGTANVLAVASPTAQCKVPEVLVKSVPGTAVLALLA